MLFESVIRRVTEEFIYSVRRHIIKGRGVRRSADRTEKGRPEFLRVVAVPLKESLEVERFSFANAGGYKVFEKTIDIERIFTVERNSTLVKKVAIRNEFENLKVHPG